MCSPFSHSVWIHLSFIHYSALFYLRTSRGESAERPHIFLFILTSGTSTGKKTSKLLHVCGKMFGAEEMFEAVQMYTIQFMKGIVGENINWNGNNKSEHVEMQRQFAFCGVGGAKKKKKILRKCTLVGRQNAWMLSARCELFQVKRMIIWCVIFATTIFCMNRYLLVNFYDKYFKLFIMTRCNRNDRKNAGHRPSADYVT